MVRFLLSVFITGCVATGVFIIRQSTSENQFAIITCGVTVIVVGLSFVPWLFSQQTRSRKENLYIVNCELQEILK